MTWLILQFVVPIVWLMFGVLDLMAEAKWEREHPSQEPWP